jgi:hypothetical protein
MANDAQVTTVSETQRKLRDAQRKIESLKREALKKVQTRK